MKNLITPALAVLALVIGSLALVGGNQPSLGNSTASFWNANGGYRVSGTEVISTSRGASFTTGAYTGAITALGDSGVGTTSPADLFQVENSSATSTLIISSGGSAVGGRLILEDHDGAGCSEIAILNGTVAAKTVTCPTGI